MDNSQSKALRTTAVEPIVHAKAILCIVPSNVRHQYMAVTGLNSLHHSVDSSGVGSSGVLAGTGAGTGRVDSSGFLAGTILRWYHLS